MQIQNIQLLKGIEVLDAVNLILAKHEDLRLLTVGLESQKGERDKARFIWWIWIVVAFRRHSLATQTSRCFLFLLPGHSEIFAAFLKHTECCYSSLGNCDAVYCRRPKPPTNQKPNVGVWHTWHLSGTLEHPTHLRKKHLLLSLLAQSEAQALEILTVPHYVQFQGSKFSMLWILLSYKSKNAKWGSPSKCSIPRHINELEKMEGSQRQLHACLPVLPQKLKPLAPALANSLNFLIPLSYLLYIYIKSAQAYQWLQWFPACLHTHLYNRAVLVQQVSLLSQFLNPPNNRPRRPRCERWHCFGNSSEKGATSITASPLQWWPPTLTLLQQKHPQLQLQPLASHDNILRMYIKNNIFLLLPTKKCLPCLPIFICVCSHSIFILTSMT